MTIAVLLCAYAVSYRFSPGSIYQSVTETTKRCYKSRLSDENKILDSLAAKRKLTKAKMIRFVLAYTHARAHRVSKDNFLRPFNNKLKKKMRFIQIGIECFDHLGTL